MHGHTQKLYSAVDIEKQMFRPNPIFEITWIYGLRVAGVLMIRLVNLCYLLLYGLYMSIMQYREYCWCNCAVNELPIVLITTINQRIAKVYFQILSALFSVSCWVAANVLQNSQTFRRKIHTRLVYDKSKLWNCFSFLLSFFLSFSWYEIDVFWNCNFSCVAKK